MRFIPFSNLEEPEEEEVAPPKKEKSALLEPTVTDSDLDRISDAIEITRRALPKLDPQIFWDDLVSQITAIQPDVTLEDVEHFLKIMSTPLLYKKWKSVFAEAGGTYMAILEFLELTKGFQHISASEDFKIINVEDIYPAPRNPAHSKYLAELVFFAGKHFKNPSRAIDAIITSMDTEERAFASKFISISFAYFSAIFYTMRFVNPSVIDTWIEVFNLDATPTPEQIQTACECWWDDPTQENGHGRKGL